MKKSILTLCAIVFVGLTNITQSQTLEDILSKHFKAVGQDKLIAAKTIIITAKIKQMGMEMPLEMQVKKPNKFVVSFDMQGQKMIQAFDGEKGWVIAPWISPDPQELTGDQLRLAQQQVNLEGDLYNYKEKGSVAELIGKVNIDGKEAYRIKLTTNDNSAKDFFLDANSYYINSVKASVLAQGQTMNIEQKMSNYKTFDGITMPTLIVSNSPMGNVEIVYEDIKFNENINDSVFKQPVK